MNGFAAVDWALWNGRVLTVFGPLLILTGISGFVIPARAALMSGAPAYNIFHIVSGAIGTALALGAPAIGIAAFNLVFGLIDIYQVVAGLAGTFPARQFRYKPLDHVLHAVFGVLLTATGLMAMKTLRT